MSGTGGHDDQPLAGPLEPSSGDAADRVEHAWDDPVWGTGIPPAGVEQRGGEEHYLELIGDRLRAAGVADLGRFRRVTDYVNMLQGFFMLRDVTILTRAGEATRVTMPELRVRLDDVAVVAQRTAVQTAAADPSLVLEKVPQRLVLMTRAHLVAGDVHVHAGGSLLHFVDSTDPRFVPMSDVRIRWLDDRTLVGHFPFALVQRSQIVGVATEGLGAAARAAARLEEDREAAETTGEEVGGSEPSGDDAML